eukprot:4484453-Pleurochrysis_carterae.AAC.1
MHAPKPCARGRKACGVTFAPRGRARCESLVVPHRRATCFPAQLSRAQISHENRVTSHGTPAAARARISLLAPSWWSCECANLACERKTVRRCWATQCLACNRPSPFLA